MKLDSFGVSGVGRFTKQQWHLRFFRVCHEMLQHAHMYVYIYISLYNISNFVRVCEPCVYKQVCAYLYMHTYIYMFKYLHENSYIYIHVCIHT